MRSRGPHRRSVVAGAGAALAAASAARAQAGWSAGPVRHLLPTASSDALRITVSTTQALRTPPRLSVGSRAVPATAMAEGGRHWRFDIGGLKPDTAHRLRLDSEAGATDPWTLRTLPAPGARPARLRVLAFTCAGGPEDAPGRTGPSRFLPLAARRALLARGLSFQPDVAIANGDHVYWDQVTAFRRPTGALSRALQQPIGLFDLAAPPKTGVNGRIVADVGGAQIADLYGTMLRSTPSWFLRDDHDYFENDEYQDGEASFPPTAFRRGLTDALQAMYWPEFLPDANRPASLPGGGASFGTLRWGRLAEMLLYDCRGYLSDSGFVPPEVEAWIGGRCADAAIRHSIQSPSTPWAWSAGKWGEWYPDILGPDGKLTVQTAKPGWRPGWFEQHQRLLAMAGGRGRAAVTISGDLHALGLGRIVSSAGAAPTHPVHMALTGPLGSGDTGFPSSFRGTAPKRASAIELETALEPLEQNGFTVMDITPDAIRLRMFAWRPPAPVSAIADLAPKLDVTIPTAS